MNLKKLMEQRDALTTQIDALLSTAETENRALSEQEAAEFDRIEKEIRAIDSTIERANRAENFSEPAHTAAGGSQENQVEMEERAFADYVLGRVTEMRAGEQNVDMPNNGAIIPTSIANRIITAVKDRCPILAGATIYNVKGNLRVPVWGPANTTHNIAVGYQTEFTEITADAGKFTSVDLGGYLAGALTLIGRSVENSSTFSVVDFIVNQMAEEIATWIEGQLLNGTGTSQAQGALNTTNLVTATGNSAITADELIELQASVKQVYQARACWTMHPKTFTALKKLKDSNNRYLLQDDASSEFPFRILGKPVYLSDNMPEIGSATIPVLYGDYSGMSVNFRENISIEVLREHYATKHALGVIGWFEFDAKITDAQKLAGLKMAT